MSLKHLFFRTVVGMALGLGIVYSSTAFAAFLLLKIGEELGFLVWLFFQLVGFFLILTSILGCYAQYITSRNRRVREKQLDEVGPQVREREE